MQNFSRWYDKYPQLHSLLTILESVDDYYVELIAQDFLQIISQRYKNNFDSIIEKLCINSPKQYKRWYDKNYNLHTCIEFIKLIENEEEKDELINYFIMSLLSFIKSIDND